MEGGYPAQTPDGIRRPGVAPRLEAKFSCPNLKRLSGN